MGFGFTPGCCDCGGGGGVITTCCDNLIPLELTLTITHYHRADPCEDETHEIVMTYDEGSDTWVGTMTDNDNFVAGCGFVADCCAFYRFTLHCIGSTLGTSSWGMSVDITTLDTASPCYSCTDTASSPCDSLFLEFDLSTCLLGGIYFTNCSGTHTATVSI